MRSRARSRLAWIPRSLALAALAGVGCSGGSSSGGRSLDPGPNALGAFEVTLDRASDADGTGARLTIRHSADPARALFDSVPGAPFLEAAQGEESVAEERGSFEIVDSILRRCDAQTVDRAVRVDDRIEIDGQLRGDDCATRYRLTLTAISERQLGFAIELDDPELNRSTLRYRSTAAERFFGFGEQFTHVDVKGFEVPVLSQEGGIGRGNQPLTALLNLVSPGSGGGPFSTYAAMPFAMTSEDRGLVLENSEYALFDLRADDRVEIELFGGAMRGRLLHGENPLELIEALTEYTGRMAPLPEWTQRGAVIGMQGGTAEVDVVLGQLEEFDIPIAAFWLQDWVGQRRTIIGQQLWWNWELDRARYPDWESMVERIAARGGRVMTYVNCFLVDANDKGDFTRNLFAEARDAGYLVKTPEGEPYLIPNTSFSSAILDITNPEARTWFKAVLRDEVMGVGASGWMADFGEALPFDAVLASGEDPAVFHNRYPEEWARLNLEAVQEAGREGDVVFFSRSGFTGTPSASTLFWEGDQMVTWDGDDGLKSAIKGLLSGGLSGISLNHSDVGGYTSVSVIGVARTKELFQRWTEMNAFSVMLRTHDGNQPAANVQFDTDADTLSHLARFAKLFRALSFYRVELMEEAAQRGWPVVRHMLLEFPDDPTAYGLDRQFMFGSEILVAPVTEPGQSTVSVYLPAGEWQLVWNDAIYGDPSSGSTASIPAPLGEPVALIKRGSPVGQQFIANLRAEGLLDAP